MSELKFPQYYTIEEDIMNFNQFMKQLSQEDQIILERAGKLLDMKPQLLYDYSQDYNSIIEEISGVKSDIERIVTKGNSSLIWFKDGSFTIEDLL